MTQRNVDLYSYSDLGQCVVGGTSNYQFFFPRIKNELPSGIGTIFSFGPENSGFNGATPEINTETKKVKRSVDMSVGVTSGSHSPSSPSIALNSSFSCQSSSSFYTRGRSIHQHPSISYFTADLGKLISLKLNS